MADKKEASIEEDIDELKAELKALREKLIKTQRTDWGLLATWAGLFLTVIGGYSYLSLTPVETEVEKLRGWKAQTIEQLRLFTDSNAVCLQRVRGLEREVFDEPKDQ
jgi:hypothetical protein